MNFPEILKNERLKAKMKQPELGEKIGVSVQALSAYETGVREPKIKTLIRIADEFHLSLDDLVGRNIPICQDIEGNALNSYEEQHLVQMFRTLSDTDKEKVLAIVKTLHDMDKDIGKGQDIVGKSAVSAG